MKTRSDHALPQCRAAAPHVPPAPLMHAPRFGEVLAQAVAINVSLAPVPFDPVKDFAPVSQVAITPKCWSSIPRCR